MRRIICGLSCRNSIEVINHLNTNAAFALNEFVNLTFFS